MNPFIIRTTCEVCGGDGMSTPQDSWRPVRHSDPAVCAGYLRRQRESLERREAELVKLEQGVRTI